MIQSFILLEHVSGIANSLVCFSGLVASLNNKEPNNIYFTANISTFHIADLLLGNLFCVRYKYKSLKYELIKYPTCISFTSTGKCFLFRSFLCIIFNILSISAFFDKDFCTNLPVLTRPCNSGGSWKYDLSICLAFGIFLISYLLDMGNFFQILY